MVIFNIRHYFILQFFHTILFYLKNYRVHWLIAPLIFFLVSLLFYFNLWSQIIIPDNSSQLTIQGESPIYEFVAETVRNNILSFKDPLTPIDSVLYPFGWRFGLDDMSPIFGLYFLPLRLFLNIHQSFILLTVLSVIISCLSMYFLLNMLKINRLVSFIIALVFGFTPFVNIRISAHPTYTALYLFTIPTIVFLKLITSNILKKKIYFALLLGLSIAIAFYTNLYYAVMLTLLIFIFLIFYFFNNSKYLVKIYKENYKYLFLSFITLLIFLIPLIKEAYYIFYLGRIDKPTDWNDIIAYSADLTNIFIPQGTSLIFKNLVNYAAINNIYIANIFENFIYPGIVILLSVFTYVFIRKKLPKFLLPVFYTALSFFVLTLGPFLHIFGKSLNIPLPYALIAYIPVIQMARSPGRFIAPFIFLSSIIAAFTIQYLLKRFKKTQYFLMLIIIGIFLTDQYVYIAPAPKITYPNKIFNYLSNKKDAGPLLEIPFSIRDSIKNFGYSNVLWSSYTQLIHKQQIFGAYAGRISNTMFSYYLKNPLIGPIGNISDPSTDPLTYQDIVDRYNRKYFKDSIEFYHLKYVVLKQDEKYSMFITNLLIDIGFRKIMVDGQYELFSIDPGKIYLTKVNFDSIFDELILGNGWSDKEEGQKSRWIVGKTARVFMKIKNTNYKKLIVEAEAIVRPQIIKVYVNRNYAGKIYFNNDTYSRQEINIGHFLKSEMNTIIFQTKYTHRFSKFVPSSKDHRFLSLRVRYISLE